MNIIDFKVPKVNGFNDILPLSEVKILCENHNKNG